MILDAWATRWNFPPEAINELRQLLRTEQPHMPHADEAHSEAWVQSVVRLEAAKLGAQLWRNNSGAGMLTNGSFVRFGLANESERQNHVIKSPDLVGWMPVQVKPYHVGRTVAVFLSPEIKKLDWKYRGDEREEAQLRWINAVVADGGAAGFINGPGQLKTLLTNTVNKY